MESKKEGPDALVSLSDGIADVAERIGPSVVQVNGRRRGSASGVVYAAGMVLTASHALERDEDLSLRTCDGRTLPARLVGRDPLTDLAVLRGENLDRPAVPAEGRPRVGQLALAVGRSSRTEGSRVALGVVSAVGGPLRTGRGTRLQRYIQTDATPFPGLSGGPLVNARGGVIGILTTGLARGSALAIPADLAWRAASSLAQRGSVNRGYLGVLSQAVRLPEAQRVGLAQRGGLLVVGVEEESPAGRGGVLLGDIVATLDGQPVEDTDDLLALLSGERVGKTVPIGVIRGGELKTLEVTVGERL